MGVLCMAAFNQLGSTEGCITCLARQLSGSFCLTEHYGGLLN